jgi:hypothetical protein
MASYKGWITGRLGYNWENDRYGLLIHDLWEREGFSCGEGLQVMVDDEWVDTRFEMSWGEDGNQWYLVDTPYRGEAIEYVRARVYGWIYED